MTAHSFRRVFAAACLGMLLFGVVIITLGSILPLITDRFGLDAIQAGSLASILPAGILLGSMVFGPIVDRYSYRSLLVISTLLVTVGLEGIAFAPGLLVLQLCFLLIGMGGGALNGETNALVADISEARPGRRSANLSLLGVFFGIGALGVPTLMALLSSIWSYEQILLYTGMVILIPLVYFLTTRFPAPKQTRAVPLKASLAMIRDVPLLMLGLFLFFESALEGIINNWTTTFLQDENQVHTQDALVALSIFVLSLTLTRVFLSIVLGRMSPFRVLLISIGILLAGAGLLMMGESAIFYLGSLILFGIGTAAGFPVILGFVSERYEELRGTAFSFVFFIALIGNILVNYLMGLIAHEYGIDKYPWMLLLCVICLFIIAVGRISGLANVRA